MDISELKTYLDLAECRHFAQTSERNHMSPSTLSRMIARLEQQLDVTLFERSNRSVELTAAGREFQTFAMTTLDAWSSMQAALQQQSSDLSGEISLYCSVTASHSLLANILATLRARHVGIEMLLHTGDQAESLSRLQAGHEDMVIAARPADLPANLAFRSLARSRLVFIAARRSSAVNEALREADRTPQVLNGRFPLILAEAGLARKYVESWLREHKLKADIYAQVSGHEAMVSMVALGFGIGAVPEVVLEVSAVRDSIQILENWPELPEFDIGLCTLKHRLDEPLIKAVWDAAGET